MKLLLFNCFFTVLLFTSTDSIIYGRFVSIKEAPYFIQLLDKELEFNCGGVIISEYWVLTAAHCISEEVPKRITTGPATDELNYKSIHNVSEIFIPGDCEVFQNGIMANDIALLRLEKPIQFNESKQPIKIRKTPVKHGDILSVFGFGLQGDAKGYPPVLKQTEVTVIDQVVCDSIVLPDIGKSDGVFCAGNGTTGTCTGDSGGPLVIDGQLAGLYSYGFPCKNYRDSYHLPDIHTRVHKFYDWIVKITGIVQ